MKTTLITIPAALTAITLGLGALGGCARQEALQGVGQPLLLPDGHSSEWLVSGGVCADPQCWTEDRVTAGVHTYYRNGQLVSDVHDMRPVTAPGAGYAAAQMIVPAAIQGGATFGAGIVVAHGIEQAGAWQAEGTAASGKAIGTGIAKGDAAIGQGTAQGDAAIGKGYAAAKPPVAIASATGGTSSATGGSAYSSSAALSSSVSSSSAKTGNLNPTYNIKPLTSVTVYNQ